MVARLNLMSDEIIEKIRGPKLAVGSDISPGTMHTFSLPTGIPHIGNYVSAIKHWVELQQRYKCVFSIVDLHSLTSPVDPSTLRTNILNMTASLLACGIDPESSILFQQSQVPEHSQLCWILGCVCLLTKLNNLPQWKDKADKVKHPPAGIYTYPVLQAADILLYSTTHVPVGEDQLTHIDLTRDLAQGFNHRYGQFFQLPSPILSPVGKIKSLSQPLEKMSKSDMKIVSRIELNDPPDVIRSKVKKAVTDFTSKITFDPVNRPGVSNLISIHSALSNRTTEDICIDAVHLDTLGYKMLVADEIIVELSPIRNTFLELCRDPTYLLSVLSDGNERARTIASETLQTVHKLVGISMTDSRGDQKCPSSLVNKI